MVDRLITLLHQIEYDLSPEEIADVLWLGHHLARVADQPAAPSEAAGPATPAPPASEPSPARPSEPESSLPADEPAPPTPPPATESPPPPPQPAPPAEQIVSTAQATEAESQSPGAIPLRTPATTALPQALNLERALKPLKRRVPSRTQFQLDEAATVHRFAEEKVGIPVLRPQPDRWFEVALVIDESPSMIVWQRTIYEWQQLLIRLGAFRQLQSWSLRLDDQQQMRLYRRYDWTTPHHPKELLDPAGRRLILVVSDTVDQVWYTGQMVDLLRVWANNAPVTLCHLLPQLLHGRTGIGQLAEVYLRGLEAAPINRYFKMEAGLDWLAEEPIKGLGVPVISLTDRALQQWAKAMVGRGQIWLPGVLLPPPHTALPYSPPSPTSDPLTRLREFRRTASPEAWQLVRYFSSVPLTWPIMRLVQGAMLPQSNLAHLAEVLQSGLLNRTTSLTPDCHPDQVHFEFTAEAAMRELLGHSLTDETTLEVLTVVSHHIDPQFGAGRDFLAWLTSPTIKACLHQADDGLAFAEITAHTLRRLGGRYAEVADRLEQRLSKLDDLEGDVEGEADLKGPLQTRPTEAGVEYYLPPLDQWVEARDLPAIVEQHPTWREAIVEALLETIGYTPHPTSPLRGEESALPSPSEGEGPGERVYPLRARLAAGEALGIIGDPRPGRLVTIPAGPFIMGSDDGRDDEKPRHEVDVDYEYQIGQYPVTHAEYAAFMEAGGYQERRYWTEAGWQEKEENGWTEPRWWTDEKYNQPNQPVVGVSWYEAVAYCNWRTDRDSDSDLTGFPNLSGLPAGWVYRLPTEAEWEKAARGTDGRVYPWGAEFDWHHVNMRIGGEKVGRPSPVGIYPTGVSPYGVYDCSGNVWEWCLSEDVSYPYKNDDRNDVNKKGLKILRGSSWGYYDGVSARCAARDWYVPYDRDNDLGFRIVCAPVFDSLTLEPLTPDLESLNPEARAETAPEWAPREAGETGASESESAGESVLARLRRWLFGGGND